MSKKDDDGYTTNDADSYRDSLIAELLLRITALENLLITKGIVSDLEIQEQIKLLSAKIADLLGTAPQLTEEAKESDIDEDSAIEPELKQIFEKYALTTRKISKGN